ncbi:MAG: hypothetical protein ACLFV1_04525 [Thiohalophilus sp.]
MRTLPISLVTVLGVALVSTRVFAGGYVTYFGTFETNSSFTAGSLLPDGGTYHRQDWGFVGTWIRVVWSSDDGFAPDFGRIYRIEWIHKESGDVLAWLEHQIRDSEDWDLCIYSRVNGSTDWTLTKCADEPFGWHHKAWLHAECFETEPHMNRTTIEASTGAEAIIDRTYEPTEFVPEPRVSVTPGSISPSLPEQHMQAAVEAGTADVGVMLVDDRGCEIPLEDRGVELESLIVQETGSHLHFDQPEEGGTGLFEDPDQAFDGKRNTITGKTNEDGLYMVAYRADKFGIDEQLIARAQNPLTGEEIQSTPAKLSIEVQGLVPLNQASSEYDICGSGSTLDLRHNQAACKRETHYVTPGTRKALESLNQDFKEVTGFGLSFNDANLSQGGLFDSGVDDLLDSDRADPDNVMNPDLDNEKRRLHVSHRHGQDIDINRNAPDNGERCPEPGNLLCEFKADEDADEAVKIHDGKHRWRILKDIARDDYDAWMPDYAPARLHLRFPE